MNLCCGCFAAPAAAGPCAACGFIENSASYASALPLRIILDRHYLVGRLLGRPGGSGVTYLAYDLRLHVRVAIKEFLPRDFARRDTGMLPVHGHSAEDTDAFTAGLRRFLHEARTLALFDHPNVVRVRGFFEENGTAYLVMDYYEGMSLQEYLDRCGGRIDAQLAVDIMLPVLDGLAQVHQKNILHCDVKPANIYLTREGRPILLDFGASKQVTSERSGTFTFLTPGFAPIELYHRGGEKAPCTDIYSCGATLYRLVTGSEPTDAPALAMGQPLVAATELVPGVPRGLSDLIAWSMQMSPRSRPQDARSFQEALLAAVPAAAAANAGASRRPVRSPTAVQNMDRTVAGRDPMAAQAPERTPQDQASGTEGAGGERPVVHIRSRRWHPASASRRLFVSGAVALIVLFFIVRILLPDSGDPTPEELGPLALPVHTIASDAAPVDNGGDPQTPPDTAPPPASSVNFATPSPTEPQLAPIRENLQIARSEMGRGEYARAMQAAVIAAGQAEALGRRYAGSPAAASLASTAAALMKDVITACEAERDVELRRGGTPPVCR